VQNARKDTRILHHKFVNQRTRLLNCILIRRDRGSRARREEQVQSVVFVLEFLRFTDVQSGKAFEIWNECAQTFIPLRQGSHNPRRRDAWCLDARAIARGKKYETHN